MNMTSNGTSFAIRYEKWCGWLLGLVGMGARYSDVVVGDDTVVVRMGWSFRSEIARTAIEAAEPDTAPVFGWGVHGWRGRWLVNGSSKGLVRMTIPAGTPARVCGVPVRLKVLRVSVVDPTGLIELLS